VAALRVGAYDLVALALGLWNLHDGTTHRTLVIDYFWLMFFLNGIQWLQDFLGNCPPYLVVIGILLLC
jgi:hypothetical protein